MWSWQESNLHLKLRKLAYYPLYYKTNYLAKVIKNFYS